MDSKNGGGYTFAFKDAITSYPIVVKYGLNTSPIFNNSNLSNIKFKNKCEFKLMKNMCKNK
jgi:hypothetical protein